VGVFALREFHVHVEKCRHKWPSHVNGLLNRHFMCMLMQDFGSCWLIYGRN